MRKNILLLSLFLLVFTFSCSSKKHKCVKNGSSTACEGSEFDADDDGKCSSVELTDFQSACSLGGGSLSTN